jgi:hypothetical protein
MRIRLVSLALVLFSFVTIVSANGNKLEAIGAFSDGSASQQLRDSLEPSGQRVILEDGGAHCDIWLRKALPAGAKNEVQGAIYTDLSESSLIGVISFSKPVTDFRGQGIKPGAYTLRYALHPVDGNHLGISPVRDFLVMIPVSVDQTPDAKYKFEELAKMSTKASETNHPAVISLVTAEGGSPSVKANDHHHIVFSSKVKSASGSDIPVAFVIKGIAEQ